MSIQEQKDTLAKYGRMFESWVNTEDGSQIVGEHRDHQKFFKDRLSATNLSKMTEQEFIEVYKKLWASNVWRRKEWYAEKMLIQRNGLEEFHSIEVCEINNAKVNLILKQVSNHSKLYEKKRNKPLYKNG